MMRLELEKLKPELVGQIRIGKPNDETSLA